MIEPQKEWVCKTCFRSFQYSNALGGHGKSHSTRPPKKNIEQLLSECKTQTRTEAIGEAVVMVKGHLETHVHCDCGASDDILRFIMKELESLKKDV